MSFRGWGSPVDSVKHANVTLNVSDDGDVNRSTYNSNMGLTKMLNYTAIQHPSQERRRWFSQR